MKADKKDGSVWVPSWVRSIGVAAWVTDPSGTICFFNERAEALFGRSASECVGLPCYRVIAGIGVDGRRFCKTGCSVMCRALHDQQIAPFRMRVGGPGKEGQWIRVVSAKVERAGHPGIWLVELALSDDKAHIESYLQKVAGRTSRSDRGNPFGGCPSLTPRESAVLRRLAQDEPPHDIAVGLHISYHTVRNYVRRILAKLGVHSVLEAVAQFLLWGGQAAEGGRSRSIPGGDVFSAGSVEVQGCLPREPIISPAPEAGKKRASPVDLKPEDSKRRYEARTKIAKALAHPTRMQMLDALREQEQCVCELTALVGGDQSTVSRHLSVIDRAGFLQRRKEGTMTLYRLKNHGLRELWACVDRVSQEDPG